tara:strand:+ start:209 stop:517 length:309 start_codon:yes stop_codon:yes gene_type:complete
MAIIKHMTTHASYDEIMERLDNALIKNESLQDGIKELNESLKKRFEMCNEYHELVEDQAEEIKTLKLDKEELEKDVKFYRSKVKVLLNDMLEYIINSNKRKV